MVKRSAPTMSGPVAKKEKVDPAFAVIQDTLNKADELPANCRAMLAAMVPGSFATPNGQRSQQQTTVIQWVENVLQRRQGQLSGEADVVASKLSQLEATNSEHIAEVQKAEATVAEKKVALANQKNALCEATITMTATKKLLAEKQAEQQVSDADFLAMKKEQEGLASAFVEHFKVPMEAGEALHYTELQPFLHKLDLQESFWVSLPASCGKTKAERGSFDDIVLQTLEQELLDRASKIMNVVSNPSPECEARDAAARQAEEELAVDRVARERASAEVAAAQKDVELATVALKQVEQGAASMETEVKASAKLCDKLKFALEGFEQGTLTTFMSFKDGIAATELCAIAGA